MITKLNLASQPFRNRTLPWAVAAAVSAVALLALVFTVTESRDVNARAALVERDLAALRRERGDLEAQAAQVREAVPPEERSVLEAAHTLVERKRFSWSKLFADLEGSLPASVRVQRISVRDVAQRGGQTRADLELTVIGRAPADVTEMIVDMQRGGIFSAIPMTENPRSGRGETGIEWTLRVSYVQRFVAPADGARPSAGDDNVAAVSPDLTSAGDVRR